MIALAEELGVGKLEVANVQYYGWAFENRDKLLPTREQVDETIAMVDAARERLKGRMRIDCVLPDYYARYPKPCMGGWGQGLMLIDPAGVVLPCHAARVIPGLSFDDVRSKPLRWIWEESRAFQRFRGDEWMQEPCRSCERKTRDFGGCRCQAFHLYRRCRRHGSGLLARAAAWFDRCRDRERHTAAVELGVSDQSIKPTP